MNNRLTYVRIEYNVRFESLHAIFYRHINGSVRCNSGVSQYLCRTVIHLYFIIGYHSVE